MKPLLLLAVAAILAGCAEPGNETADRGDTTMPAPSGDGGGQGFAVQQGAARGSNHAIDVDVRWRACDAGYCANATARNNGTATVQVSSICQSPWEDRMARDGDAVQHREPQFTCLAYGRKDFAPGDVAYGNLSWDGTLWEGDKQRDAPTGQYTWTIAFWWDDGEGGGRQEASADVQLLVGVPT